MRVPAYGITFKLCKRSATCCPVVMCITSCPPILGICLLGPWTLSQFALPSGSAEPLPSSLSCVSFWCCYPGFPSTAQWYPLLRFVGTSVLFQQWGMLRLHGRRRFCLGWTLNMVLLVSALHPSLTFESCPAPVVLAISTMFAVSA